MTTQHFTQTTIFLFFTIILLFTSQFSLQQSCTSSFYSETESPLTSSAICPVSYVNLNNNCQSFATAYKQKKDSSCTTSSDCYFDSMTCVNNKCLPSIRLPGDSCVDDIQCLHNIPESNRKTMVDFVGPKCINSKCQNFKIERRNDGEDCFIDKNAKTIYDCKDSSICYQCCAAYSDKSKCVPKVKVKKGQSCLNSYAADKSTVVNYKYCESGLYCKAMSDGSQICSEPLLKGANCANSTTACEEGTVCRQNSIGKTCQPVATLGESCVLQSDCAYGPSYLVRCYNNKCQRFYGAKTNEICKKDEECYTGYCSSEGRCAERSSTPCSTSANCAPGDSCACGGKGSSVSSGKCVDICRGALIDVATCLYNQGLNVAWNYYVGLGSTQFVDEDSSAFTKCRFAYSRYYSCMRKSWIAAGISTKGEMAGIDLDAYSIYANPVMPERNGACQNQLVFGLIFMISIIIVNFVL